MSKQYYVYIATNLKNTVLYTGITNNIQRRMNEHRQKLIPGFTSKYNVNKLQYIETFETALEAITSEKKIKGWTRNKKIELIKSINSSFKDLL